MNLRANLARLRTVVRGKKSDRAKTETGKSLIEEVLAAKTLPDILDYATARLPVGTRLFLGDKQLIATWLPSTRKDKEPVKVVDWDWPGALDFASLEGYGPIIVSRVPTASDQWELIAGLKQRFGSRIVTITELLLPFTQITILQKRLSYFFPTFDEVIPYYLGLKDFAPFEELNRQFPLQGRTVIEFGPLDGCQTAGLVKYGARRVDCIEARGDNVAKTRAAAHALGWENVRVIMDDFHNADRTKYGRYDLAFAHGVYYHSVTPFLFLENLVSLSDNVFLGGFCATDDNPAGEYFELKHDGAAYRVKSYDEGNTFVSGMNRVGYFFTKEDLIRFFERKGYAVKVISDKPVKKPRIGQAGIYLRFLAQRAG
jgi:hypothetical protein